MGPKKSGEVEWYGRQRKRERKMLIEKFSAWLFLSRDFAPDELMMQGTADQDG